MKNKRLWLAGIAIVIVLLLLLRPFSGMSLDPFAIVAKVTVMDEDGKPVESAETDLLTYKPIKNMALSREIARCPSNTKGKAILTGHWGGSSMGVLISASKPGYYASGMEVHPQNGQTAYWRPDVKLVLRKIKNPVPMYVKNESILTDKKNSFFREGGGYDLVKGDWVRPHGKGEVADFIFHCNRQETDEKNYQVEGSLTFTNPDDGIMLFSPPKDMHSVFIFHHDAPPDGYKNKLFLGKVIFENVFLHRFRKTKQGDLQLFSLQDENLHYIFRVRTVRDIKGNIVSACYGTIRKEINFDADWKLEAFAFLYYLNPDPTSRSLECNGKNLFGRGEYGEYDNCPP